MNTFKRYIEVLVAAFNEYSQAEQMLLIRVFLRLLFVGSATVLITFIYPLVPAGIRLVAVPAILIGSWILANRTTDFLFFGDRSCLCLFSRAFHSHTFSVKLAPTLALLGIFIGSSFFIAGLIFNIID